LNQGFLCENYTPKKEAPFRSFFCQNFGRKFCWRNFGGWLATLPVGMLNGAEVKVPKHGAEHGEDGEGDGAVVLDLAAEEQVAQVGEGEEDDGEHHAEPRQLLIYFYSVVVFIYSNIF
jgi:hypothetical protein